MEYPSVPCSDSLEWGADMVACALQSQDHIVDHASLLTEQGRVGACQGVLRSL